MADYPTLHTRPRTVFGKAVKHLRREGWTPIVVYGATTDTVSLETETTELLRVLSAAGGTQLIAIEVEGEPEPRMALAREVQRHVTRLTPLHADFLEVDVTQVVTSEIPITVEGEPGLAQQGEAILQTPLNTLTVEALPGNLPPAIVIDGTQFEEMDDTLYVRDLDLGPNVRALNEPDEVLARLAPARMEVPEPEEEEEVLEELPEEELPEGVEPGEEAAAGEEGPDEDAPGGAD